MAKGLGRKRPLAAIAPWMPQAHIAAGKVALARVPSSALHNERAVWVYTSPGYSPAGSPAALLLLFDGEAYLQAIPTPTILDNLAAAGRIAPTVAVLIDSIDEGTRERELPCHAPMVEFLTDELLPWVRTRWNVTSAAATTTIGGASYGGLAAAFAAFRQPDIFGQVLAQSGSFWWRPAGDAEHEWLTRQFVTGPRLPLRFYLSVGQGEARARVRPNQLIANRHLRDILQARGYPLTYVETDGKHEHAAWRAGLADALAALLGPPPAENG